MTTTCRLFLLPITRRLSASGAATAYFQFGRVLLNAAAYSGSLTCHPVRKRLLFPRLTHQRYRFRQRLFDVPNTAAPAPSSAPSRLLPYRPSRRRFRPFWFCSVLTNVLYTSRDTAREGTDSSSSCATTTTTCRLFLVPIMRRLSASGAATAHFPFGRVLLKAATALARCPVHLLPAISTVPPPIPPVFVVFGSY